MEIRVLLDVYKINRFFAVLNLIAGCLYIKAFFIYFYTLQNYQLLIETLNLTAQFKMLNSGSRGNKTALLASLDTILNNIERIAEIDGHLRQLEGICLCILIKYLRW